MSYLLILYKGLKKGFRLAGFRLLAYWKKFLVLSSEARKCEDYCSNNGEWLELTSEAKKDII